MANVDVSYVDFQARASSTSSSVQVSSIDFVTTSANTTAPASTQLSYIDLTAHAANANPAFTQVSYIDLNASINTGLAPMVQVSFIEIVAQSKIAGLPTFAEISYLDFQATGNPSTPPDAANAGNDVVVRPFNTYTITGVGSSVGTWSSNSDQISFSQLNGVLTYTPLPSLTGSRVVMTYTVGTVSDSMIITIYPVSERALINGLQYPIEFR